MDWEPIVSANPYMARVAAYFGGVKAENPKSAVRVTIGSNTVELHLPDDWECATIIRQGDTCSIITHKHQSTKPDAHDCKASKVA